MAEVTFRQGEYQTIDYTPGAGDVEEGQVILLGNTTGLTLGVAHQSIANNVLGSLATGGIWEATNLNNSANYAKVYWDDSANKVTSVSTNNALFGFVVERGGGGANSAADVELRPYV